MAYDTETKAFTGIRPATEIVCWCGVRFAVPRELYTEYKRRNDARPKSFSLYCPLGHGFVPGDESEADKLRRRLELTENALRASREAEQAQRYRTRAQKAQVTRIRNRVKHGVCPCCTRTFENLARHMKSQHPDWTQEAPE